MNTQKKIKKIISIVTILAFSFSNLVVAAPISMPAQSVSGGMQNLDGVQIHSLVGQIAVPENIGEVTARFSADANSPVGAMLAPVIVHIQDAHSNYEAQVNIKKILDHVSQTYGVDAVFLEGVMHQIDPDLLRYFKEDSLNQEFTNHLAEEGIVGGTELFLIGQNNAGITAYGVENAKLYRANLEAFRSVMAEKELSESLTGQLKASLLTLSSHVFNKKLSTFFKEWLFYQDVPGELLRHVNTLKTSVHRELKLDLENAREQLDWPQLVRFFRLQQLEACLDRNKASEELEALTAWIKKSGLNASWANDLDNLVSGKSVKNADAESPRTMIEKFYDQAAPLAFSWQAYPRLKSALGLSVLRSEIDAKKLFNEIHRLTGMVLDKLAVSAEEKALLSIYQDYLLVKKLLALELVYEDFAQVENRRETVKPSQLAVRLEEVRSTLKNEAAPLKFGANDVKKCDAVFEKALVFYAGSRAREQEIYRNMTDTMKANGKHNAVLITGGFHSDGLSSLFREHQMSYVEVIPRITQVQEKSPYVDVMTLKVDDVTRRSYANHYSPAEAGGFKSLSETLGAESASAFARTENTVLGSMVARHRPSILEMANSPAALQGGIVYQPAAEGKAVATVNGQPLARAGNPHEFLGISSQGPVVLKRSDLPVSARSEIRARHQQTKPLRIEIPEARRLLSAITAATDNLTPDIQVAFEDPGKIPSVKSKATANTPLLANLDETALRAEAEQSVVPIRMIEQITRGKATVIKYAFNKFDGTNYLSQPGEFRLT
ncbi:MAG: hypothetical protein PHN49_01425 [Candidatus Omnitrophica bacterium]|nr:hypothetical protein [Candidatus Omnitrophota bacterium]